MESSPEGMAEYGYAKATHVAQIMYKEGQQAHQKLFLGVLNYGNVWTQGIDMAFTQIIK